MFMHGPLCIIKISRSDIISENAWAGKEREIDSKKLKVFGFTDYT